MRPSAANLSASVILFLARDGEVLQAATSEGAKPGLRRAFTFSDERH